MSKNAIFRVKNANFFSVPRPSDSSKNYPLPDGDWKNRPPLTQDPITCMTVLSWLKSEQSQFIEASAA